MKEQPQLSQNGETKKADLILDRDFSIARVDERLFGSFIEHLGRAVYGGIYDPGSPLSDSNGFRRDVLEMVKRLNVSVVRYPGGNFVSGFHWEDSIGPPQGRPKRLDLAWSTTEPNEFGLHEFCAWARAAGGQVMYAVNLGTRGPDAARNVVEYANHSGGSAWSDLRRQNGAAEPFGIKLWCLGNEMDGPWQIGQKTAYEYGRCANESAKVMKWVDPSIELVACGSSAYDMPTFGAWELEMLDQCYENVDYVSLHRYYGDPGNDPQNFLAKSMDMEAFIRTVVSLCDAVGGRKRSRKKLSLSFDEWNVWYRDRGHDGNWQVGPPLIEEKYDLQDALVCAQYLNAFIRRADLVKVACLAQIVNVIAAVLTSNTGTLRQTIYYPSAMYAATARGLSLTPVVEAPRYDAGDRQAVPVIDVSASFNESDGKTNIFVVNRSASEPAHVTVRLADRLIASSGTVQLLTGNDPKASNTWERPDNIKPQPGTATAKGQSIALTVPALGLAVVSGIGTTKR